MQIEFNKYQGAGNDFIIIDNRSELFPDNDSRLIASICKRHLGIGADGLILITNHKDHDFEMHYFNADGKRGSMCGNGGRCAFAFSLKKGIIDGEASFVASDGIHTAIMPKNDLVKLSMKDVSKPLLISGNHFIDTGSPHYIIPVPHLDKIDVPERGRAIRWTKQFAPGGTNVNFVELHDKKIKVRTFERGVEDETLSCGTGITASAISSRWGHTCGNHQVIVETSGGTLEVCFNLSDEKASEVFLSGPVAEVFKGIVNTDNFI